MRKGKKNAALAIDMAAVVRVKVGERFNAPVREVNYERYTDRPTGVTVELPDGGAFLPVSELPDFNPGKRDEMLLAVEPGVTTFKVEVTRIDTNGPRARVYVSAKKLLIDQRDAEDKAARAQDALRQAAGQEAWQALERSRLSGTILTVEVTEVQSDGVLVKIDGDQFHIGKIWVRELTTKGPQPGAKLAAVILWVEGSGPQTRFALSELAARRVQTKVAEDNRQAAVFEAILEAAGTEKKFSAKVVRDNGSGKGLLVLIDDAVEAVLPDSNLLDASKRASVAAVNQRLTVSIVEVDDTGTDPVITVRQGRRQ